jgi:hypothetical protein
VDEALMRHDRARAELRATRAHLGLDVVAGRALLMGDAGLARTLATPVVLADPGATGARMVLATAGFRLGDGDLIARAFEVPRSGVSPVAAEALLPFARMVLQMSSRRMLDAWSPLALLEGDALVTPLAVELAALGAIPDDALPRDGWVELTSRRSDTRRLKGISLGTMDARHVLFAWALERPLDRATLELAQRLAPREAPCPLWPSIACLQWIPRIRLSRPPRWTLRSAPAMRGPSALRGLASPHWRALRGSGPTRSSSPRF